jgi:hypothetical protein
MQVTSHPDHDVVILSLWQGQTCTATFQLPVADAPELIDVLVLALADAAQPRTPKSPLPHTQGWRRAVAWARSWLQPESA